MTPTKSIEYVSISPVVISCFDASQVLRKYLVEDTCTRVEKSTRVNLVDHLLMLDLNFFADKQIGSLHGRMNRSLEGLVK